MRTHTLRKTIWSIGILLWFGSLSILVWAWLGSQDVVAKVSTETRNINAQSNNDQENEATKIPDLKEFASVWSRRMQRPLYDPPPKKAPAPRPKPKPRPLQVRLLGTMLESGTKAAMFAVPGQGICIRKMSQQINTPSGEATILEIEADHVVVEYAGQKRTLTLDAK